MIGDNLPTADEILNRVDETMFPESFECQMSMINYDRPNHIDSRYTYNIKSKYNVGSLLTVMAPSSERGTKILMKQQNMWMFVPGQPNSVRLSKAEDFMGSTFSNNDLMDSDMEDDYSAAVEDKDGLPAQFVLLRLTAERDDVPYARIDLYIWRDDFNPAVQEFYSRSGQLLKKMVYSQKQMIAGRLRPTRMVMESVFEPGRKTILTIDALRATNSFPSSMFNEANLVE